MEHELDSIKKVSGDWFVHAKCRCGRSFGSAGIGVGSNSDAVRKAVDALDRHVLESGSDDDLVSFTMEAAV